MASVSHILADFDNIAVDLFPTCLITNENSLDVNAQSDASVFENNSVAMHCLDGVESAELAISFKDLRASRQDVDYFPCQLLTISADTSTLTASGSSWNEKHSSEGVDAHGSVNTQTVDIASLFNVLDSPEIVHPSADVREIEGRITENEENDNQTKSLSPLESILSVQDLTYNRDKYYGHKLDDTGFAILDTILEDIEQQMEAEENNSVEESIANHKELSREDIELIVNDNCRDEQEMATSKEGKEEQLVDSDDQSSYVKQNTKSENRIFSLEFAEVQLFQDNLDLEQANLLLSNELDGMKRQLAEFQEQQCEKHVYSCESRRELLTLVCHVKELGERLSQLVEERDASVAKAAQLEAVNGELKAKLEEETKLRIALNEKVANHGELVDEVDTLKTQLCCAAFALNQAEHKIRNEQSTNTELQLSFNSELKKQDDWNQEKKMFEQLLNEQSLRDMELGDLVVNFTNEQNRLVDVIDVITQEKGMIERQLDSIKKKLDTFVKNDLENQASLNRHLGSIRKLEIENKALGHEQIFLKSEFDQLLELKRRTDDDLSLLKEERESLVEQMNLLQKEKADVENINNELLNSNSKRAFKIAQLRYANKLLKRYVSALNSEKDSINLKVSRLKSHNHNLKNDVANYKTTVNAMETEILTYKESIISLENQIKRFQQVENDIRMANSQLETRFQEVESNYKEMSLEVTKVRFERLEAEDKVKQLVKDKIEMETSLNQKDECILKLREELAEVKCIVKYCWQKQSDLENGSAMVDEKIMQIQSECNDTKLKLEHLKSKVSEYESTNNEIEMENKRLQCENSFLIAKHKTELENSTEKYKDVCLNLEKQLQLMCECQKDNDYLRQTLISNNKRKFLSIRRKTEPINSSVHEPLFNESKKNVNILSIITKFFHANRKSKTE